MKKQPQKSGKGSASKSAPPSTSAIDGKKPGKLGEDVASPAEDCYRHGVDTNLFPSMAKNPPYGADELARLAAALLPETVKQGLAAGDLWPGLKRGYFPSIIELDNAIAAAAYLLNRACEHALLARYKRLEEEAKNEAESKEIVPFIEAAKKITREKRADRAEAKLAKFLLAVEGSEEKARHFEAWKKDGILYNDVITLTVTYVNWDFQKKEKKFLHRPE